MQLRSVSSSTGCEFSGELPQDLAGRCVEGTCGLKDHGLKANPLPFARSSSLQMLSLHPGIDCCTTLLACLKQALPSLRRRDGDVKCSKRAPKERQEDVSRPRADSRLSSGRWRSKTSGFSRSGCKPTRSAQRRTTSRTAWCRRVRYPLASQTPA